MAGQLINTRAFQVLGLTSGIVCIAICSAHTCDVLLSRTAKCRGDKDQGQLGLNPQDNEPQLRPRDVTGLSNIVAFFTTGNHFTCGLSEVLGT